MNEQKLYDLLPGSHLWGKQSYASGTDGIKIHYIRSGSGFPILLLHGWPGFWYDWRRILPRLSRSADVIAPDFRGFGESDKPDLPAIEAYTPDVLAADIISVLDELRLEKVIIAAYDIGATIAQLMARNYPSRVESLVLMGPSYAGIGVRRYEHPAQREFWYQHFHNLEWSDNLVSYNRDTLRIYLTHFYHAWMSRKDQLREIEFEAIVDMYARPGAFKASIQYYRARAASRLRDAMTQPARLRIDLPTSVLWGEDDMLLPAKWADRLPEFFPNCTTTILPGVGHFIPLEAPQVVLEAILQAVENTGVNE